MAFRCFPFSLNKIDFEMTNVDSCEAKKNEIQELHLN